MRDVIAAIEVVVDVDLPVAGDVVFLAIEEVQFAQAQGLTTSHQATQEITQRLGLKIEIDEYEGLPDLRLHRDQTVIATLEILHTDEFRHSFQGAVQTIVPAMIGAMQERGDPAGFGNHLGGMMPTDVVEGAQLAIASADGHDRFSGHGRAHKSAGLFDLIGSADRLPGLAEDRQKLKFGDTRVNVPWRRDRRSFRQWCTVVVTCENLLDRTLSEHGLAPWSGVWGLCVRRFGSDRAAQDIKKLVDASLFLFAHLTLPAKKAGVEFLGEQRILKTLHGPVEDRDDHLEVEVVAQFVPLQTEADKSDRAIGIFGHQETIDLAFQGQIGSVVSEQGDPIRDPVFMQQVLGLDQPIAQDFEEAQVSHIRRDVQVSWKGSNRLLVDLEEQAVLAAEVLKHRSLGDSELGGNVTHTGRVVTLFGEVAHGGVDDSGAFGLRAGTRRNVAAIFGGTGKATGNFGHDLDLKSRNNIEK